MGGAPEGSPEQPRSQRTGTGTLFGPAATYARIHVSSRRPVGDLMNCLPLTDRARS